jgi:O-antigen/teichoic acid export membrane protein
LEEITSTSPNSQKNKRIAKNTLMLYFRMTIAMFVSLYTSRIVLNTLGVEDYGIYNVVGGVVVILSFFNKSMSAATQRFLSYELGKEDFIQLRKTFNASQIIHIGIAVLVLFFAWTIGLWFLKNYLIIPKERMESALWVYHFSVFTFIVNIFQVPYNAVIIAHERMNVYAYVSIVEVSLKLVIVFLLTWISFDKLKLYGILQFCLVLFITTIYRIYTVRNFSETKFQFVKDKELYKTLISYSWWTLFGTISDVSKGQGVNIILNMFFGPIVNAARGISMQVQNAVNNFAFNIQLAVKPQIIKSYASNEMEYMHSLIIKSSKFSFYLLFLLSLPIMLEVDQILILWLKTVPEYASLFTVLVLVIVLITSMSNPLVTGIQATGNIKIYFAVSGSLMILILPFSYIYFKLGYPPEVTLYIAIIIEIFVLITRLFFLKKLINFPITRFIKEVFIRNTIIVILSTSLPLIIINMMEVHLIRLFITVLMSIVWNGFVIFAIGLSKNEKQFIMSRIGLFLNKIRGIN